METRADQPMRYVIEELASGAFVVVDTAAGHLLRAEKTDETNQWPAEFWSRAQARDAIARVTDVPRTLTEVPV